MNRIRYYMLDSSIRLDGLIKAVGIDAGVAGNSAPDDLTAKAVSATITSTGDLVGTIQENASFPLGIGYLPAGPQEEDKICPTGGAGLGIPKGIPRENQLAAATFIEFLTSPENAVTFPAQTIYTRDVKPNV